LQIYIERGLPDTSSQQNETTVKQNGLSTFAETGQREAEMVMSQFVTDFLSSICTNSTVDSETDSVTDR